MNMLQIEIILIASIAALACVLPGVFLVLRGVSLMSDAISHAILPGIALMFLCVNSLQSPLLLVGAALSGLLTVVCTEFLITTQRLKKDAAIGLVFPLFFSLGVIVISMFARDVHLDTDMVLLGELAFASLNRLMMRGIDVGSQSLWIMSGILVLNAIGIWLFFKELQVSAFDGVYSWVSGCHPHAIYYVLMAMTSVTAVAAFDVVGAIVVVALMITPPATAFLCTNRLPSMIKLSCVLGIASAVGGYLLAAYLDVSIAGSIAFMSGILFIGALFLAPRKGLIGRWLLRRAHAQQLAPAILCAYLQSRHPAAAETQQIRIDLGWESSQLDQAIYQAESRGWVQNLAGSILLTRSGVQYACENADKFCVFS